MPFAGDEAVAFARGRPFPGGPRPRLATGWALGASVPQPLPPRAWAPGARLHFGDKTSCFQGGWAAADGVSGHGRVTSASPGARLWGPAGSTPTRDRRRGGNRGRRGAGGEQRPRGKVELAGEVTVAMTPGSDARRHVTSGCHGAGPRRRGRPAPA